MTTLTEPKPKRQALQDLQVLSGIYDVYEEIAARVPRIRHIAADYRLVFGGLQARDWMVEQTLPALYRQGTWID